MLMPVVMTPKGLLPVNAILGFQEMAPIVQTLMNAYSTHAILMLIVKTPKVPLSVNAIVGILEMVLTVLT